MKKCMMLLLALLLVATPSYSLDDISFNANLADWNFSNGTGFSYEGASEILTMEMADSEFHYARYDITFNTKPTDLYFAVDVYFDGYTTGDLSYEVAKLKVYGDNGTDKQVKGFSLSAVLDKTWVTAILTIEDFDNWASNVITLEISSQNASAGTYKVKNPRIYDYEPASTPYSFPYIVPADPSVSVDVNTSSTTPFKDEILSANSHFSWSSFSWSDPVLVDVLKNYFPMKNLRFPGGTVGNFYNWETDQYYTDDPWTDESYSRASLSDKGFKFDFPGYAAMCDTLEASSTLMFNVIHDDVTKATNRYKDRKEKGLDIAWVEMGNENYYGAQAFGNIADGDHVVSVTNYLAHTEAVNNSIKAYDPTAKIALNIDHHDFASTWTSTIAQADFYDAIIFHTYFKSNENTLSPISGKKFLSAYKETLHEIHEYDDNFPGVPAVVSEWGILESPNSFLSVLSTGERFLAFLQGAKEGIVAQAGMHILAHGDSYSVGSMIYKADDDGQAYFSHTGVIYSALIKNFVGKELYQATVNSPELETDLDAVYVEAIESGDSIKFFAINKLPIPAPLNISFDGNAHTGGYSMKYFHEDVELELAEPSPRISDPETMWQTSNGTGVPSLPAYSAVIITVAKDVITPNEIEETIAVEFNHKIENNYLIMTKKHPFKIYNHNGELMLSGNGVKTSLNHLPSGSYVLDLQSQGTESFTLIK